MTKPATDDLRLRPIGENDYSVMEAGEPVARIRLAVERTPEIWVWNITLPAPSKMLHHGVGDTIDEAKAEFREAWARFKADIGPDGYASAIETARNARDRRPG
jgi:predicted RNase H-like HicB family nuclease